MTALHRQARDSAIIAHERLENAYAAWFDLWERCGVDPDAWHSTESAIAAGISALAAAPANTAAGITAKIEIAAFLLEPEDDEIMSLLASALKDLDTIEC